MTEIIFASFNEHKTKEIMLSLSEQYTLVNLHTIGFVGDIPEPFETFKENALHKVAMVARLKPESLILSEDSGLEIHALKGAPGVYSARYALRQEGQSQAQANIQRVLQEMQGINELAQREARFVSTFCLRLPNQDVHFFTGHCYGYIAKEILGASDFGYDPIFIPQGSERSFGEMSLEEKRHYSHREQAWIELQKFLANTKFS